MPIHESLERKSVFKEDVNYDRDYMKRKRLKVRKEENKFITHIVRFEDHGVTLRWKHLTHK